MSSDPLDPINAKIGHLSGWLVRYKSAGDLVPEVQRELDVAFWERDVFTRHPVDLSASTTSPVARVFERENDYLAANLPIIPDYDTHFSITATAHTSSGTFAAYSHLSNVVDTGDAPSAGAARLFMDRYQDMQAAQDAVTKARGLIGAVGNSDLSRQFEAACEAQSSATAGVARSTLAGVEIRNLLENLKGRLWSAARNHDSEKMTWKRMAERLACGAPGSLEQEQLAAQEASYSLLHERLTNAAKNRAQPTPDEIRDIWALTVDHVIATLGLVDQSSWVPAEQAHPD